MPATRTPARRTPSPLSATSRPRSARVRAAVLAIAAFGLATSLSADVAAPGDGSLARDGDVRLLRYPDIHREFVVFVYAGDIWRAELAGGAARRLTSHAGLELFPTISPDGTRIAFTAEYTGSRQVYVMPSTGGAPRQLTFYADVGAMPPRGGYDYWIQDWTADGRILVRVNRTPWGVRMGRYALVDPAGGLERELPIPHGGGASLAADGKTLAYCPVDREFRTWKRTRGGRAQDVWIYDLEAKRSERLTTHPGDDNFPMWIDGGLYFASDRDGRVNLYALGNDGATRALTRHRDDDVQWPASGAGQIVYVHDGGLRRLDVASGEDVALPVTIAGDLPAARPRFVDASEQIQGADIAPDGKRAVFDARGDLFTVPAKHGPTLNLTRTQGVRERDPAWSPDGRYIAYLSDATGEYELWLRRADGSGEPRRLTDTGAPWKTGPMWSPDSSRLAFGARDRVLRIVEVADGTIVEVDRGEAGTLAPGSWSPDSRWLAYTRSRPTRLNGIALYSVERDEVVSLGDGLTSDSGPTFSRDGKYLFFQSGRDFNLRFSAFEFNYVYDRATRPYGFVLAADTPSLFPIRNDAVEIVGDDPVSKADKSDRKSSKKKSGDDSDDDGDDAAENSDAPPATRVDADGFDRRTFALPGVPAGQYGAMAAVDGALLYVRAGDSGPPTLYRYDFSAREEKPVAAGVGSFGVAARGGKLLVPAAGSWSLIDPSPSQDVAAGKLDLSAVDMKLDPRAEWRQIFEDAWRLTRDWFYDENMHGFDWDAIGARYRALVPHVAHRSELDVILGDMVAELEAGHTYVSPGDVAALPRVSGGMLGCRFEPHDSGRYVIASILPGENWHATYRSPLTEPGIDVAEGEFLLAIDGVDLRTDDSPFRLLENTANRPVVLRVSPTPSDEEARDVTVVPTASEKDLRYLEWVRDRMALVDRLSGGRIGYIHLPNTAIEGNRMLQKLFYGQAAKDALIVDDRYNGGGFIPDRMIEYLARTPLAWWARRDIESMRTPGFAHAGPKAMLVNGYSSSGGDALPYFFRQLGLGPIVGTRTWGGLIGLTGNPPFVDGGSVQIPTFRIYDASGEWVVENEGVAPDVEVFDVPEGFLEGGDPSVEKAVEWLLRALEASPPSEPAVPTPPVLAR